MSNSSKFPDSSGSGSPGHINQNVYNSVAPELCKQSLLTVFKLSYKGVSYKRGFKDVVKFLKFKGVRIDKESYQDLKSYDIEDYDVTLLKTLLAHPEICDLGEFSEMEEKKFGDPVKGDQYCLDYSEWRNEKLHGKRGELPSLEFWIREIVFIRNDCSHSQKRDDITEDVLNEKSKTLKYTLKEMILRMRTRYPDVCKKSEIDKLDKIIKEKMEITAPIWKDITPSLEKRLMEKVFEFIGNGEEINIMFPLFEDEETLRLVHPSRVYLNIKGKDSADRKISSTTVLKELRNKQSFPNRCMVLVGLPGMGKTTTLLRIKEEHKSAIKNEITDVKFEASEDIECLIYQALRNNEHNSFTSLLDSKFGPISKELIPNTLQLQHILMNRNKPFILLLDAIDESSPASKQLIRNIWKIKDDCPNLYTIFTTRGSKSNVLKECTGDDYASMCINVAGLDPSEFIMNAERLIDYILGERNLKKKVSIKIKEEALSNLQKIKQKFPPVGTNPLLLTIAVRLVTDPDMRNDYLDNLKSMTQLIKGMMGSLKRRLCRNLHIDEDSIINNYLDFLASESLSMLQRNEFTLNSELIEKLKNKIMSLEVNEESVIEKVLQSFLSKKEENIFQHLHAVTQAYLAAKALQKILLEPSVSDLKVEVNEQMKGIPKEHQQTVLMLLTGILHEDEDDDALNTNKDYILNEIALTVCSYFDLPQYNYFDAFKATQIHLFQEAFAGGSGKPNKYLEREILNKSPDSININEEALEALEYIMNKEEKRNWPKEITISIKSNIDHILKLDPVLELLNKRKSTMYLELFQCSETLLGNLPDNVEKMWVLWDMRDAVKMVDAFNTRLPNLQKLNMLTIDLNEGGSLPKTELPQLCYGGNLLVVNICEEFNDDNVAEAARIMHWICGQQNQLLTGLNLGHSTLSGTGCLRLLDELSRLGVKASWLSVFYARLAPGEHKELQKKAESIGIRLFTLPGVKVAYVGQPMSVTMKTLIDNPHFIMDMINFGLELWSTGDNRLTPTLVMLIREFSRSTTSMDSDIFNIRFQDDFISFVSESVVTIESADPERFRELCFKVEEATQNDKLNSDSGSQLKELISGFFINAGKKIMNENPAFALKMMVAVPPQLLSLLMAALSTGATARTTSQHDACTENIMQEEDLD